MHTDKLTWRWGLAFALAMATTGATAADPANDKGLGEEIFTDREVHIETAFSRFDLNDSDDMHWLATLLVAIGTLISAL